MRTISSGVLVMAMLNLLVANARTDQDLYVRVCLFSGVMLLTLISWQLAGLRRRPRRKRWWWVP